jgi:hypothetical protein
METTPQAYDSSMTIVSVEVSLSDAVRSYDGNGVARRRADRRRPQGNVLPLRASAITSCRVDESGSSCSVRAVGRQHPVRDCVS